MPVDSKSSNKTPSSKRRIVYVAIVLILIAVCGLAFFLWRHNKPSSHGDAITAPYHQTYSQVTTRKINGPSTGEGMSFQSPVELTANGVQTQTFVSYCQIVPNSNPPMETACNDAKATHITNPVTDAYLKDVNDTLVGQGSPAAYQAILSPLSVFVLSAKGSQIYNLDLGAAKAFTNSSIKSNAWVFDFKVTPKNAKASNTANRSTYNGKVVYAIGKQTVYYFSITDIDYNWQGNQATWQKVLDSLKIDQ